MTDLIPLPAVFLNPHIGTTQRILACIFPFVFHTFVGQVL
eukprot:SAG25_NODE_471_length_7659_cov_3.676720_8_plen_40_part_00